MILSVSRRTDIPAFFADWFFNRLAAGYLYVRNPMNIHQISKIILTPQVIDCIVFWTKNPGRMLTRLRLLDNYCYYFQYTITGYDQKLEPNIPSVEERIETFLQLSSALGPKRVIWRYDPIIFTEAMDESFHQANFAKIAKSLQGKTSRCVVSFLDLYKKTIRTLSSVSFFKPSNERMLSLAQKLHGVATGYGIKIVSCAEEIDLEAAGISPGRCIDDKLMEEITGFHLKLKKDKNQREACGCVSSIDIGAYNTCPHACLYCYANFNAKTARQNFSEHDPSSPLLFGKIGAKDKVSERKMFSCRELQGRLF